MISGQRSSRNLLPYCCAVQPGLSLTCPIAVQYSQVYPFVPNGAERVDG